MNKRQWFWLGLLVVVSTALGQWLLHTPGITWGWHFEVPAWFAAWLFCFVVLKRNWLYSIAAVITISILEDALFLLWDRIVGRYPWGSPFYCHDWIPGCANWFGVPSHYVLSLLIAGNLVVIGLLVGRGQLVLSFKESK